MGREAKERISQTPSGRSRAIGQILPSFSPSRQRWFFSLALVFSTSLILRLFFTGGHTHYLDGASHTAQALMVYESLQGGELPLWSNRWYGGYPLLQFYPPLFFYLTTAFNFLLQDIFFSIKLMDFIAHILSGIMAFLLVEEITDDREAGFIGGLAFALSPWHIYHIIDLARHTSAFVYAFLPLPFLFFEKYRHQKFTTVQGGILIGLSLSLLVAFQYAYALFIAFLLAFYVILRSVSLQKPFFKIRHLYLLGISGLVLLSTASGHVIPYLSESQYVSAPLQLLSRTGFPLDSADITSLVTRQGFPEGHKGYIGLSFLALSFVGAMFALRNKKYPMLLMYVFCFYVVLGHQTFFYQYIPFIYSQQVTSRLILYLILFMAIMAGEGVKSLKGILARYSRNWIWPTSFLVIVGICFLDVMIGKDRHWPATHGMEEVYDDFSKSMSRHEPGRARTIRSIQICSNRRIEWLFSDVFPAVMTIDTPASSINGYLRFHAPKNRGYINDGRNWLKRELERGNWNSRVQKFLYLMNVSYTFHVDVDGRVKTLETPRTSPAIGAGELSWREEFANYPEAEAGGVLEPLIEELGLNEESNSARRIVTMKNLELPKRPFDERSRIEVTDFEQTINKSFLEVESSDDCYLQIAHSYYPFLRVYVDGGEVPFYETALGFIALSFPEGRHDIKIEPYLSATRKVCHVSSGISLILAVAFYVRWGKKSEGACLDDWPKG